MKVETDICIIGAGPVGLFAIFEAGLHKMRCHVVDSLLQVGGQLSEIYPQKPIYDIPVFPTIQAQQLVDNLMEQTAPFQPTFTLGEKIEVLTRHDDGSFTLLTNEHTRVDCKVVVIAGGLGCFEPRKPVIENLKAYEGKGISYMVKNPEAFRNRRVVLAGGGDSALDWTILLADIASEVTLLHRGTTFRGAPSSVEKVYQLAAGGKIRLLLQAQLKGVAGTGHLQEITYLDKAHTEQQIATDHLIPLYGLSPKLGPVEQWHLTIDRSAISVSVQDYQTNIPGVFAIGDINTYPGKLKLILCGFHEAAMMVQSAFKYVYPQEKIHFQYTTVYGVNNF